ncbi:MAG: hypothetical protein KDD43_07995, partial [Bdellovibrionales bacterium]|nr:hypothetical protein [Bdellovibrionales bacterium]
MADGQEKKILLGTGEVVILAPDNSVVDIENVGDGWTGEGHQVRELFGLPPRDISRDFKLFVPIVLGGVNKDVAAMQGLFLNSECQRRDKAAVVFNDTKLNLAAGDRISSMIADDYFSHQQPNGWWPHKVIRNRGYVLPDDYLDDGNRVEILVGSPGGLTPEQAHAAWLASPDHKKYYCA